MLTQLVATLITVHGIAVTMEQMQSYHPVKYTDQSCVYGKHKKETVCHS